VTDLPIIAFESADAWEEWLEEHHAAAQGVWLKFAKKASGKPSVTYVEAVNAALCFGWIDGQAKGFDADYSLQRFTPRRPKSAWSQINRGRADTLIAQGKMRAAGLREVERARADGRWDAAYASPSRIEVPEDFQAALDANPAAAEFFATLTGTNRYAFLYRITTAKKPETRQKRIEQFIAMLAAGEKLYP
jgi:uncharacterized protein YdeI (YjbR/CyaY-like superfamily)